jgi:undecaprenyl-diphosphatase
MLNCKETLLLGTIQGVSEYFPISSSAHLFLAEKWMGVDGRPLPAMDGEIWKIIETYNALLQWSSLLVIAFFYGKSVKKIFRRMLGKCGEGSHLLANLLIAFLPTAIGGLLFHGAFHGNGQVSRLISWTLHIGGIYALFVAYRFHKLPQRCDLHSMTTSDALRIGLLQCIALIPGISRSLMTISGGLFIGLSPKDAVEFSFLLAFGTISAATLYQLLGNGRSLLYAIPPIPLLLGCCGAFLFALVAMRLLQYFLKNHFAMHIFLFCGLYRIFLALFISHS